MYVQHIHEVHLETRRQHQIFWDFQKVVIYLKAQRPEHWSSEEQPVILITEFYLQTLVGLLVSGETQDSSFILHVNTQTSQCGLLRSFFSWILCQNQLLIKRLRTIPM